MEREKTWFVSGGSRCAAWHYPGSNGGCVIMAAGGGITKEPGTDRFAARFNDAGFTVLAFDFRRLGESGGEPRQLVRVGEQLADWRAAITHAATLPGVDPARIALWAFSLSAGHILAVAARDSRPAAAIVQSPFVDGIAASRAEMRHQTPSAMLRFTGRGILDALGSLFGGKPRLVPLAGPRGTVAMLTTPDGQDGDRVLNPGNRYPEWQQTIAARSALRMTLYRPGRHAARVKCPLLLVVCDNDQSVLAAPATAAAKRAPRAELVRLQGTHYAPFHTEHDKAAQAELKFLTRHLAVDAPKPTGIPH